MGREIALTLARQGAAVIATDILPAELGELEVCAQAEGLGITSKRMDVTSEDDWAAVAAFIDEKFGKLDILVNNAGIMETRSFFDTSLDDYRRTMRVNAESMFIGAKAMVPLLTKAGQDNPAGASMVNLSSVYGQISGPWSVSYCASKGAVRMLTKALAVDLARARTNIRVNSVHPGAVNTAMLRTSTQPFIAAGLFPDAGAINAMLETATPLGRMGEVDDMAGVVAFLASDASKFMTGSEVTVDGGASIV
jgi:NAD(P)-dependent dehydrogenase (short-subunit alcohol dehydrogenase family)